jgi:hypothetical protein
MASARPMVISEPLCFLTRKFGRYAVKQLKDLLYISYRGDFLSTTKDILMEALVAEKLDGALKTCRKRRDSYSKENSDAKVKLDIDDLVATLTYLDENKLLDRLPIFVAADPDLVPSPRLLEGDMVAILAKMEKIETKCTRMQTELETTRALISKLPGCKCNSDVGVKPINKVLMSVGGGKGASTSSSLPPLAVNEDSSARESEGDFDASDSQEFSTYESKNNRRRSKKRLRVSTTPPSYSEMVAGQRRSAETIVTASNAAVIKPRPGKPGRPPAKQLLIGHSTTSTMKAAKNLNLPKSFYRIGNIDACYSADDLRVYIEGLDVRVVSCFERTSEKSRYTDNKTFRVCIFDADKDKLLCDGNWFVGISIQKWVFKPKPVAANAAGKDVNGTVGAEAVEIAGCNAASDGATSDEGAVGGMNVN